ncbi:unnamed protein product, partial [Polarella glacialis]
EEVAEKICDRCSCYDCCCPEEPDAAQDEEPEKPGEQVMQGPADSIGRPCGPPAPGSAEAASTRPVARFFSFPGAAG